MGTRILLSCGKVCALRGTPIVVVREMDTGADGRGNGGRRKSQEFIDSGIHCNVLPLIR